MGFKSVCISCRSVLIGNPPASKSMTGWEQLDSICVPLVATALEQGEKLHCDEMKSAQSARYLHSIE